MKKLLVLATVLALMLVSTAALAATPGEVVGTWYGCLIDNSYEFGAGIPLGDYRLELNRDGTAQLFCNGSERPYTWKVTDEGVRISTVDQPEPAEGEAEAYESYYGYDFELDDGLLATEGFYDYGMTDPKWVDITFARTPVEIELPGVKQAEAEDDFFGDWSALCVEQNGTLYAAPSGVGIKIEFAQISFLQDGSDPIVVLSEYVDGTLTCDASAVNSDSALFQLAGEGVLVVTLTHDDEQAVIYFTNGTADIALEEAMAGLTAANAEETGEEAVEEAVEESVEGIVEAAESVEEIAEEIGEAGEELIEEAVGELAGN